MIKKSFIVRKIRTNRVYRLKKTNQICQYNLLIIFMEKKQLVRYILLNFKYLDIKGVNRYYINIVYNHMCLRLISYSK